MPRLLKRLKISSVDLCRRGANPLARVALSKSEPGEDLRAQLLELAGAELTSDELLEALMQILERAGFAQDAGSADGGSADAGQYEAAQAGAAQAGTEDAEPGLPASDDMPAAAAKALRAAAPARQSGPDEPGAANWAARLLSRNRARCGALPMTGWGRTRKPVHPEVRRALAEVRALRDALAHERATAVAKRYEGVCDAPDELAGRLARLRALDGEAYNDYVALLDELAEARRVEPFMKEYGSARGAGGVLDARVAEIMRAEPNLTRAQAVVRAYQSDPDIPEVL